MGQRSCCTAPRNIALPKVPAITLGSAHKALHEQGFFFFFFFFFWKRTKPFNFTHSIQFLRIRTYILICVGVPYCTHTLQLPWALQSEIPTNSDTCLGRELTSINSSFLSMCSRQCWRVTATRVNNGHIAAQVGVNAGPCHVFIAARSQIAISVATAPGTKSFGNGRIEAFTTAAILTKAVLTKMTVL